MSTGRSRLHRAGGGSAREASISNGVLRLEDAVFADATTPVVAAASAVHNGIDIEMQNGSSATVQSIAGGATWTWPLAAIRDALGRPIEALSLVDNRCGLALLERGFPGGDALPLAVTCVAGFSSTSTPKASAGQGLAAGFGWPSTDVRRVEIHTRNGGAWSRTAGTGRNDHFGVDLMWSGGTNLQVFQSRAYALDSNYDRTGVVGSNIATATLSFDMSAVTHLFVGVFWDAQVSGTPRFVFDPCFFVWPRIPWV